MESMERFEVRAINTVSALQRHIPDHADHALWATYDPQSLDLKVWLSTEEGEIPTLEAICVAHWLSLKHGVRTDSLIASYDRVLGCWRWWLLQDLSKPLEPIDPPDLSFLPAMQTYRWRLNVR